MASSIKLLAISLWIGQLYLPGSNFLQSFSGLASSPYQYQTSWNLSLDLPDLHAYLDQTSGNLTRDWPALSTWINFVAISLWIGQFSIPGSNFLQSFSGLASSPYQDQTSWNLSLDLPVLLTWIKFLEMSLWMGQLLSLPRSNFLQPLSGLAQSPYLV